MNIMIAGASGLIGQALVHHWQHQHNLTVIGRNKNKLSALFNAPIIRLTNQQLQLDDIAKQDVIINLAGENIADKRWTTQQKQRIITSRVNITQKIARLCAKLGDKSPRLFNASAIGIYGISGSDDNSVVDETTSLQVPPTDFLATVGQQWEAALEPATSAGVTVTCLRFGVVLSCQGGMIKKLLPPTKLGLGSIIGHGTQAISWITLTDAIHAIDYLIHQPKASGCFNLVATEVVTQAAFAKALAKQLNRPCFLYLPAFLVRLLFGQMGDELLLAGQRVSATRLAAMGFVFQHPTLNRALKHLFSSRA